MYTWQFCCWPFWDGEWKRDPNSKVGFTWPTQRSGIKKITYWITWFKCFSQWSYKQFPLDILPPPPQQKLTSQTSHLKREGPFQNEHSLPTIIFQWTSIVFRGSKGRQSGQPIHLNRCVAWFTQWLFRFVPLKGGIGSIVHPPIWQVCHTTYIPLIVLAEPGGQKCYLSPF